MQVTCKFAVQIVVFDQKLDEKQFANQLQLSIEGLGR